MADYEKKKALIEVEVDSDQAAKDVDNLTDKILAQNKAVASNNEKIKELNKANKELQKEVKKGTKTQEEANEEIASNEKEVDKLKKANLNLRDGLKDLNSERREAVKATKLQSNTLNALKAEAAKMTKQLGDMKTNTQEEIDAFNALSKTLKGTNERIRDIDQGSGNFKTTIGNYPKILGLASDAFDGIISSVGGLSNSVGGLSNIFGGLSTGVGGLSNSVGGLSTILGGLSGKMGEVASGIKESSAATKGATTGFQGMTKAAIAFIATPIGVILGAIAAAFMLVKTAVERNERLMTKLTKAVAPLGAMIEMLFKALEPLAELLIDGIVVGLSAATKAFDWFVGAVGDGLEALGFDDASKAVNKFADDLETAAATAVKIIELEKSVRGLNRALTLTNATLEGQIELFQQMGEDDTLSFDQQRKGLEEARKLRELLFQEQKTAAEEEIKLIQARVKEAELEGRVNQDLLDEQAEATAKKIQLGMEYAKWRAEDATIQRQLERDEWEQSLDFAIDVGTRRTEEAQRAAENEKLLYEDRVAALAEARRLDEEAFNNQLRLFEEVGLSRTKINQLVNESNAAVIDSELKKTELNEIERNRFRELVLERQGLTEGLMETEKALEESRAARMEAELEAESNLTQKRLALEEFRRSQANDIRLGEVDDLQDYYTLKREIESENFNLEIERLDAEAAAINEKEFEIEEEKQALLLEKQLAREELEAAHRERLQEIEDAASAERINKAKETEAEIGNIVSSGQKFVFSVISSFSSMVEGRYRKRFENLEKQYESGAITEEEYNKRKEELEKKQAKKLYEIEKKRFLADKIFKIATIAINTALAVSKSVAASPLTYGLPWSAINAGIGIAQGTQVALQKPPPAPSFAEGGMVIKGKSHTAGGEDVHVGGRLVGNMQGDEGLFITKREATIAAIDAANTAAGGRSMYSNAPRLFEQGGRVDAGMSRQEVANIVAETVSNMPPIYTEVSSLMAGMEADADARKTGVI